MKNFLLILILTLGFFLRAQETLSGNFLFLKDQGRDLLAVKSIVVDKKLTLIGPYTGFRGVFQGPLYYYALAVPFALSRGDPLAVMWLMLAVSMFAILFAYVIGKRFFSETTGLFAAFLFAVSPSAAAAATFIWSPFFILPLMSVFIYFLLDWIQTFSRKSFFLMTSLLGLMFHFEIAFAAPFMITMFILCWHIARKKKQKFPAFLFIGIIVLFLSPLLVFDFRHDHLTLKSIMQMFYGRDIGLGGGEAYTKIVRDHIVRFILNLKATFSSQERVAGIFVFFFLLTGLFYAVSGTSQKIKLLLFMPIALFAVYLFYPYQIWDWYVVGLFPVYLLLGGIFLSWLWKRWSLRIIAIILVLILLYGPIIKIEKLYGSPDYGGTAKLKGKIDAIETIFQDAQRLPFNLLVFTPVVLTDAYDYLLWWYGQKKYGYLPGQEKKGTLYLLIEPDPSKPWSYEGWLETVVKEGAILDTQELPSGFIIQKRTI